MTDFEDLDRDRNGNDPYDDLWEEEHEETTPTSGSTPVKQAGRRHAAGEERPPQAEARRPIAREYHSQDDRVAPKRATGEQAHQADARRGAPPDLPSRPALPRQSRQARPIPPPPEPYRGLPADQVPEYPPARGRRRPQPVPSRRDSGFYLPWWSLLIMLIFVGTAAIGAWAVVGMLGGDVAPGGETPIVIVVTATFTIGPPAPPSPLPMPPTDLPPVAFPTAGPTPTLPPGDFRIGLTVEVVGVGVEGLRIRSGPGRDSTTRYFAIDGERFRVTDGPELVDGLEWWELEDLSDPTRAGGWAARPFLQEVSAP